jgi:hypothetical protein
MMADGVEEGVMMTAAHRVRRPGTMIAAVPPLREQTIPHRVHLLLPVFLRRALHNLNVTMITEVAVAAEMRRRMTATTMTMMTEATMVVEVMVTMMVEMTIMAEMMTTDLLEQ